MEQPQQETQSVEFNSFVFPLETFATSHASHNHLVLMRVFVCIDERKEEQQGENVNVCALI